MTSVKCVVWDLDNTLWHGVLLEGDRPRLRSGIRDLIRTLDARGILHSIASRNDPAHAGAVLDQFGLKSYFLCPQIGWGAKRDSLQVIARELDIGTDSLAFVDDEPMERDEVAFSLPEVLCLDPAVLDGIAQRPELNPEHQSDDSPKRRTMYAAAFARSDAEARFEGSTEDFLASLGMTLTIAPAKEADLCRAAELVERTHQFNSTGHTFSYEELEHFRTSANHTLLVAGLEDRYGSYGKIGLALIRRDPDAWTLKLLLVSCRVLRRGMGGLLLNHVRREARHRQMRLFAELVPNDRNVLMSVAYKLAGLREVSRRDGLVLYEDAGTELDPWPAYVTPALGDWRLGESAHSGG